MDYDRICKASTVKLTKKVLLTVRITRFYWSSWWSVCYFQCCGLSIIVCSIVLFILSLLESVSDDLFGILCPLFCLSLLESQLLMTSLVSSDDLFGIFWWPLWYLLMTSLVSSDDLFGIFKPFLLTIGKIYFSAKSFYIWSWNNVNLIIVI